MGPAFLRKYNTAITATTAQSIKIPMVKRGVVDFAVGADWTPATGDVKVSKDGGAAANIATLPAAVAMGNTAYWEFVFSGTELSCGTLAVTIADSATKAVEDQSFLIETFGNASALYPMDWSDVVRMGLTALPNAAANAAGGLPISIAGALDLDEMNADIEAIQTSTAGLTYTVSNKVDANTLAIGGTTQTAADVGSVVTENGADVDELITTIGAAGAGLTAIPLAGDFSATMKTSLQTAADAAITANTLAIEIGADADEIVAKLPSANIADETLVIAATNAIIALLPTALSTAGNMKCDLQGINNNTGGVAGLDESTRSIVTGTVGSASTTTSIVTSSMSPAAAVTDQFKGRIVIFDKTTTTVNLRGQATDITGSSSAGVLTVSTLTTAPVSGDTFCVM